MKIQPVPTWSTASYRNYSLVNPSLSLFIETSYQDLYQDLQPQEQRFYVWGVDTQALEDKTSVFPLTSAAQVKVLFPNPWPQPRVRHLDQLFGKSTTTTTNIYFPTGSFCYFYPQTPTVWFSLTGEPYGHNPHTKTFTFRQTTRDALIRCQWR